MSILNIVLYPDDPLTQTAEPYESVGPEIPALADDMLETMIAYEGVGLAGPQVGITKRIFVMREPDGDPMCLINPEILESEGEVVMEEGCLSLPHIFADVPRAQRIVVRALDHHGKELNFEAIDYKARIILHELDHLNGTIFLDRLDILTRQAKIAEWEEVRQRLLE